MRIGARTLLLACSLLLALVVAVPPALRTDPAVASPVNAAATDEKSQEPWWAEEEEGLGPAEPDGILLRQRAAPRRTIPRGAYQEALAQARVIRAQGGDPALTGSDWKFAGPERVGGRVVDLAVDADEPNVVYAAAATGGVWKSTDAGRTFQQSWDPARTQSMGAIEVASDGTIYAGTGEPNMGGGSVVYPGSGVYASSDDGQTWQHLGLSGTGTIGDIVVDPTNPDRLFVAASGPVFTEGGNRGLYRSTDGGVTWDLVLEGPNATTGAIDIAMDPQHPDRIWVSLWDRIRYPDLRRYGGAGSGVLRSADGGDTWEPLTNGLPHNEEEGLGRIAIAVAPSNPDRLYATVIKSSGHFEGAYTSTDGGSAWTRLPDSELLEDSQSSFGWWFGEVYVDPEDPMHVFVPGVPLLESTDGGQSWTAEARDFHVDQHAMTWSPHVEDRVYLGNDGGVYRSDDNGSLDGEWISAIREPYTQFYTLAVSAQDPSRMSGGTQDNGSLRSWGADTWNRYLGGDGLQNLIDPSNQETVFACYQYGNCFRSTDGGDSLSYITDGTTSDRRQWFSPLVFEPGNSQTLYYAGNRLNRSEDRGETWEVTSPDLTGGPDGPWPGGDGPYPYGTISAVAVAPSDTDRLYVGTDDTRVWTSPDGGQTWQRLDESGGLPERWVTSLAVHPRDPATVYVTFSGYKVGDEAAHVFVSHDAGQTWADVSGNLPNAPVNDVQLHPREPNRLYVATDVGVFGTRNAGVSWFAVGGDGLPLAPVTDLEYHADSRQLFSSTFGRGIYRIDQERGS